MFIMFRLSATATVGWVAVQDYCPSWGWIMFRLFATVTGGWGAVQSLLPLLGMGKFRLFANVTGGLVTVQAYCPSWGWVLGNVKAFCHWYRGMANCSGLLSLYLEIGNCSMFFPTFIGR